jgi:hypothetical protein
MTTVEKTWFIEERAKALAFVLLTRRDDLIVTETKEKTGLDFLVNIRRENDQGERRFGILLRATMTPVTIETANSQLKLTMRGVERLGPFNYPVCVFYFTVKDNQGYFTWAYEPIVNQEGFKLKYHKEAHCTKLDDQVLDGLVSSVNTWYDSFYSTIVE